jgi:hypothetical protein
MFIMHLKQGPTSLKPTILMTITLFLLSAPAPDSNTISEVSAGFLMAQEHTSLLASQNRMHRSSRSSLATEIQSPPADLKAENSR